MNDELVPVGNIIAARSSMILSRSIKDLHDTVEKLDRQNKNLTEKVILLTVVLAFIGFVQALPLLLSVSRFLAVAR